MKALVCEKCGGPLKLKPDTSIAVCDFCGTEYYLGADEKEIEKRLEAERKEAEKRAKEEKEAKIRRKCNQLYELKRQGYNESIRAQKQMDKLYDEYSDDSVFLWEYVSFYTDRFKNESFLMLYKSHWSALKQNAEEAIEMAEGEEKERRRKEWEEYRQKNEDAAEAWEREKAEKAEREKTQTSEKTQTPLAQETEKTASGKEHGKFDFHQYPWRLLISILIIGFLAVVTFSKSENHEEKYSSIETAEAGSETETPVIEAETTIMSDEEYESLMKAWEEESLAGWRDESLKGRGRAESGTIEPRYVSVIGYVVPDSWQEFALEKKEDFQDPELWKVPTYKPDKQFWVENGTLPHKTEVVVREQMLEHEKMGRYSGYLLVEKKDDGTQYYINVENFITKPYWTYQSDLREAARTGYFVAEYNQKSDYYPVDSGGKKLEIPDGTKVLVTGITSSWDTLEEENTGIEAVVWKEWKLGYGGVKCHFNEKDLAIIY